MEQSTTRERLLWADLVRVVSILLVIFIHVGGNLLYKWGSVSTKVWLVGDIYDSVSRVCVPLFFMVSGYFLLSTKDSMTIFLKKRLARIGIPFLVWSLLYSLWRIGVDNQPYSIGVALTDFLSGGVYYHLWFMYPLIGFYLVAPVLSVWVQASNDWMLYWILILWFIGGPCFLLFEFFSGIHITLDLPFSVGYFGYFLLGYMFGKKVQNRLGLFLSGLVYLLALLWTVYGTYLLTQISGNYLSTFQNYLAVPVVLMSATSFLLLKSLGNWLAEKYQGFGPGLAVVSNATFGIYLVHVMFLFVLEQAIPGVRLRSINTLPSMHPLFSIPLTSFLAFILSGLAVLCLKRIPVLRRTV